MTHPSDTYERWLRIQSEKITTRRAFCDLFDTMTQAVAFEDRCLSVDEGRLPPSARRVVHEGVTSKNYWRWLASMIEPSDFAL